MDWRRVAVGVLAGVVCAVLAAPASALAQDYPTRTVRIIVPFPAGGSADLLPRLVGDWLSRKWSQPVVIENRTGAGGNVGAEAVAKAEPDGYTLLSTPPGPLVVNQNLYPKMNFEPADFAPVSVIGRIPNSLLVSTKVPANIFAEFLAYARANPGKLSYASQGNGTTSHLTAEMFNLMAKVKMVHVPYRGSAPALQDLVAGNVDVFFDNLGAALQLVRGGQVKLLAVATEKRVKDLPDVPAVAETIPGFSSVTWFAMAAPPKTDSKIVAKINADVAEALRQPEIVKRMAELSAEPVGGSVQQTAAFFREETERWAKVIKEADIKIAQ
jgi:tripartite-type tricarboxylate transporter receptor subunit TctC